MERILKVALVGTDPVDYAVEFARAVGSVCDVTLYASESGLGPVASYLESKVELRLLPWPRHRSPRNPALVARLLHGIRRQRPDVIHLISDHIVWLNLLFPLVGRIPVLVTTHDVSPHPGDVSSLKVPRWSVRLARRQASGLVVHGEHLKERAMRLLGLSGDTVHVIPHPVMGRYAALARESGVARGARDRFNVLFFGRIREYKGLPDLVASAERVVASVPQARFVVAGQGDDLTDLRSRLPDPSRFEFRNRRIPDAEVVELFAAADVVVMPYREASESGVTAVAAAFGKAVVATDVGELGRTVRRWGMGIVVPPRRPDALAEAIARLATDERLRGELEAGSLRMAGEVPALVASGALRAYERTVG